ncbi:phosphoglycerate mutase family protein [Microbulbifer magnicolonia]|uniref:SixA phosphatase family protein n=1 Tax=Microbulbifer magnicolonia TaxID=3109744 RepID=UPI002B40EE1E|nr:phosphoglycerate mutase family protein [Microbulbifer sp. GG15]
MIPRFVSIIFLCLAGSVWAGAQDSEQLPQQQVIYLVRHAEKVVDPGAHDADPALNEAGLARAQQLAHVLGEVGIDRIFSTDTVRTRNTVAPLAKKLGLRVQSYDPRALPEFARQLQQSGERILVVGHSNTTPQLVELLGADGGAPIVEATEYDRLYIVIRDRGRVTTLLQRYGAGAQAELSAQD